MMSTLGRRLGRDKTVSVSRMHSLQRTMGSGTWAELVFAAQAATVRNARAYSSLPLLLPSLPAVVEMCTSLSLLSRRAQCGYALSRYASTWLLHGRCGVCIRV